MLPYLSRRNRNKETQAQRGSTHKRRLWRITAMATLPVDTLATRGLAAHHRMKAISPCQ
jgi:hypothetical protein